MTASNGREVNSDILFEEFTKDVEAITEQVTLLVQDIQESKLHFNNINSELNHLIQNVKEISNIIRNDDSHKGSLLTRMALLEKSLEEVKVYIEKDTVTDQELNTKVAILETKIITLEEIVKNLNQPKTFPSDDKEEEVDGGKWKFYITIATGIFTILGTVVAVLLESGC
jgi:chromosome segregation ATPase